MSVLKNKKEAAQPQRFHPSPDIAAEELDATMYFLHRRYRKVSLGKIPQLRSFFIDRLDVVFSDVPQVIIEKHWDKSAIAAIAPKVPAEHEETRRAELHILYSPMLVRCQVAALGDIYQMLQSTLDETGKKSLLREYREFRRSIEEESTVEA
jgi:uncharacterized protein YfeS